jgi:hypothetical protein
MSAFFLLCSNLGSVLGLLQGLDWLRKQGHTDKDVSTQLTEIKAQVNTAFQTNNPGLIDNIFNTSAH